MSLNVPTLIAGQIKSNSHSRYFSTRFTDAERAQLTCRPSPRIVTKCARAPCRGQTRSRDHTLCMSMFKNTNHNTYLRQVRPHNVRARHASVKSRAGTQFYMYFKASQFWGDRQTDIIRMAGCTVCLCAVYTLIDVRAASEEGVCACVS